MSRKTFSRHNDPLHSDDLFICRKVLDAVCKDIGIHASNEEAERIGAITIELYQHGVRDEKQLRTLVEAARGVIEPPESGPLKKPG